MNSEIAVCTDSSIAKPTWFDLTHCMQCRYNLAGLPRDGQCPECGQPYSGDVWVLRSAPVTWRARIINLAGLGVVALVAGVLIVTRNPIWIYLAIGIALSLAVDAWSRMRRPSAADPSDADARRLPTLLFDSRAILAAVNSSKPIPWNRFNRLRIQRTLGGPHNVGGDGRSTWNGRLVPPFLSFKVTRVVDFAFYANQDEMLALQAYIENCLRLPES